VMMELLTGALGGSLLSHEIVQADASGLDAGASKLFVAIDVGAFGDRARFEARVDDLAAYLREGAPDPTPCFQAIGAGKRASITSATAFLFIPT